MFHAIKMSKILLRILGIKSQIINFRKVIVDDIGSVASPSLPLSFQQRNPQSIHDASNVNIEQRSKYWKLLSIIICLTFTISYPLSIIKLLQNPTNGKKSVNYFITYLYYSAKYVVTLIIYVNQFIHEKKMSSFQLVSCKLFKKIYFINRNWKMRAENKVNTKLFPLETMQSVSDLSIVNYLNIFKVLILLLSYIYINYLKLLHIFHLPVEMNLFDLIWYYYPNVFISLFVTQFYVCVVQQAIIFNQLNTAFEQITWNINDFQISPTRKRTKNTADNTFVINEKRKKMRRFINRAPINTVELSSFMSSELEQLIGYHDSLRKNNKKIEQLNSLQVISIIVNAFMNIVSEVSEKKITVIIRNKHQI